MGICVRIWQQSGEAITVAEWAAQRSAAEETLDYSAGRHTHSNKWSIEQMQTVSVTQALGTYARANRERIQAGIARRKAEERQGRSGTVGSTSGASVIQVSESSDSAAPEEDEGENDEPLFSMGGSIAILFAVTVLFECWFRICEVAFP